jgi:hypothetical protein
MASARTGIGRCGFTVEQAREEMGPIADAFALDQQVTSVRARDELGWNPPNRDVFREIAEAAT